MKADLSVFTIILCALTIYAGPKEIYSQDQPLSEETLIPKVEYKPQAGRDPFQGYVSEEKKQEDLKSQAAKEQPAVNPPQLKVQGIIWGSRLPQAIINNQVVKSGDTIEGTQIIDIGKNGVSVLFNNNFFKLKSPASIPGGEDEK